MRITVNGQENTAFNSPVYVTELLEQLELAQLPVIIEVDKIALHPREYPETLLQDGAIVEIIRVAAGG